MTKSPQEKLAHKLAVQALREKHYAELENTLLVYVAIRDNPKAPAMARVNAGRRIEAMLGMPRTAQEKPAEPPRPKEEEIPAMLKLRPELMDELDRLTTKRPS